MSARRLILCVIMASMLVVIGCSSDDDDEIYGTWGAASMELKLLTVTDVIITLSEGGTYTLKFTSSGSDNFEVGTFTPIKVDENADVTFTVSSSAGPAAKVKDEIWYAKYTDLSSSTMNLYMNRAAEYEGPYIMNRQ
jgi:hypothetical protein